MAIIHSDKTNAFAKLQVKGTMVLRYNVQDAGSTKAIAIAN
jgi:hypothetical protein